MCIRFQNLIDALTTKRVGARTAMINKIRVWLHCLFHFHRRAIFDFEDDDGSTFSGWTCFDCDYEP